LAETHFPGFGKVTSMKSEGYKLVSLAQTSPH